MIRPKEDILRLPLQERLDLAAQATWEKVLEEHRRAGIPLAILRDGKVVEVPAEELLRNGEESTHGDNEPKDGQ